MPMFVDYQSLIQNLLNTNSTTTQLSENEYCLSCYFPYQQPRDRTGEIQTKFKAFVQEHLKQFSPLEEYKTLRNSMMEEIARQATSIDYSKEGAALFIKFQLKEDLKGDTEKSPITDIYFEQLHIQTAEQFFIGKYFDLDQLVANQNADLHLIVLDLQRYKCDIYQYRQASLEKLESLDNTFVFQDEVSGEVRMGDHPQAGYWNTGEDTAWIPEEDKHFLSLINEKLLSIKVPFDSIIIYHSTNFSKILDQAKHHLHQFEGKLQFIEKNYHNSSQIKEAVDVLVKDMVLQTKQAVLNKAREDYTLFTEGWVHVCEASRKAQIDTLFMKPKSVQSGRVLDDNLVFIVEQEGAKEVENVIPWLVKAVLSQGGKLVMLSEAEFRDEVPVSCKLRF
jgi:hypothetical protein